MAIKKGRCQNFKSCNKAKNYVVQEVDENNFKCDNPECGAPLKPMGNKVPTIWPWIVTGSVLFILVVGGVTALFFGSKPALPNENGIKRATRKHVILEVQTPTPKPTLTPTMQPINPTPKPSSTSLPLVIDSMAQIQQHINMAIFYAKSHEAENALKELQYAETLDKGAHVADIPFNIGVIYATMTPKQPRKAIEYLEKARNIEKAAKEKEGKPLTLFTLAVVQAQIKNMATASDFLVKAIQAGYKDKANIKNEFGRYKDVIGDKEVKLALESLN